jgi:hypothetical protein
MSSREIDVIKDPRSGRTAGIAASFCTLTYSTLFASPETVQFLAGREMFFEYLGALFFLLTSGLCFLIHRRMRRSRAGRERFAYILLGCFFFVAFGEEISWGQAVFGFSTPETFTQINRQDETNLHNLWLFDSYGSSGEKKSGAKALLNSNRLFDYFMIGLFFIVPIAAVRNPDLRRRLLSWGMPIFPTLFALVLCMNVAFTALWELWLVDDMVQHLAVSETREMNYAALCLAAFAWEMGKPRSAPR